MKTENGKSKLLYLAKLFHERTDESHGLSMPEIIAELQAAGISAERKAVYRDIAALQEAGIDIRKLSKRPVEYALCSRLFSSSELLLLVDAVQSSRFLTQSQARKLVGSLQTLGSDRQSKLLNKRVHVSGRIKSKNESVFYNVDIIQEALALRRKVSFNYAKYDGRKRLAPQREGKRYCETPVQLMFSDGYYYLVAYNDHHEALTNYRVDRMQAVAISDEKAVRNELIASFDPAEYDRCVFGMFSGEPATVTLQVEESLMNAVIDRFGTEVQALPQPDGTVHVTVIVADTPLLFGWITQFEGKMVILHPASLAERFADYLESLLAAYRN